MWLIGLIVISPVLVGFWFLPMVIRSFGHLALITSVEWVGAALFEASLYWSIDKRDNIAQSVQLDNAMTFTFSLLAVVVPLYGFTLGAIPQGIRLRQGRETILYERAWHISLVAMFALPGIPMVIYGN